MLEESEVKTRPSAPPSGLLLDSDIQWLSERFTEKGQLKQLAHRGLKMETHYIQLGINNHPNDFQSAVHDVLRKWQFTQVNREEALHNLLAALEESNFESFAEEMKKLKTRSSTSFLLSEDRKYFSCFISVLFNAQ